MDKRACCVPREKIKAGSQYVRVVGRCSERSHVLVFQLVPFKSCRSFCIVEMKNFRNGLFKFRGAWEKANLNWARCSVSVFLRSQFESCTRHCFRVHSNLYFPHLQQWNHSHRNSWNFWNLFCEVWIFLAKSLWRLCKPICLPCLQWN